MFGKWMIATWLLFFGTLLGTGSAMAGQTARQAQVTSLNGQVEWLKSGSATWQAAAINQKLGSGDKVKTGEAGQVTLTLDDGSTIQLFPGSEFAVQTLTKGSANEQLESILAIMKGRLKANVTPLKGNSKFEIETPAMVASVKGTTFTITINPDGSVGVASEDGAVDLTREGENKFVVHVDTGDEVLVEVDPVTGDVKITSKKGSFEVIGPDGISKILNEGDSVIFHAGAATFIPLAAPVGAPTGDGFTEPTSGSSSTAASSLSSPASGV